MKKTNKNKIEEFIRVDHAGERGAIKIYEGQLLALNTIVKNDELKKKIKEMQIHEKEHADYFEKEINMNYCCGFSIQPKFSQSAYFRFHNKSEIYNGLYFVGAGTHPGAGVPGVLSSAKVLDKIL